MKKIIFLLIAPVVMLSCTTSKESRSSKNELKKEEKLVEQAMIEKAVLSRKFIIKFERLYFTRGGIIDLVPRANYIVVDGKKAIISTAYIGRQYGIMPIEGINMHGEASSYELKNNTEKGLYEIKMKVTSPQNSFDVYITIGKNGSSNASINNARIDFVRYSGYCVPIKTKTDNNNDPGKTNTTPPENIVI
ncbi:MAG TPA: DUF4251 domain-containing protein [Bacteroidales bacterium]|nr:DUF4251 domain-containing protein [Bacteroidales bacterium]HPT20764.1 DUF4251 domain-containing protein [Bacteroidales bacterium]